MKSLLALMLVIFMVAVLPHAYAIEDESGDTQKKCVLSYLSCKDTCDYHADAAELRQCKIDCDHNFQCRPAKKHYKIPSLYN